MLSRASATATTSDVLAFPPKDSCRTELEKVSLKMHMLGEEHECPPQTTEHKQYRPPFLATALSCPKKRVTDLSRARHGVEYRDGSMHLIAFSAFSLIPGVLLPNFKKGHPLWCLKITFHSLLVPCAQKTPIVRSDTGAADLQETGQFGVSKRDMCGRWISTGVYTHP